MFRHILLRPLVALVSTVAFGQPSLTVTKVAEDFDAPLSFIDNTVRPAISDDLRRSPTMERWSFTDETWTAICASSREAAELWQ